MKILGCMPTQKVMDVNSVQSLVAFQADIYNRHDSLIMTFTNGHNPVLSRVSLMRNAALTEGVDYVIWLDSDHIYKAQAMYDLIKKMEENKLEALSAGYLVRSPCKTFAHGRFMEDGKFLQFDKSECKGLVDADVLGFGFFVMKHAFVKDMVDKYGSETFKMDYGDNTTEDVYFCRLMKKEGYRICFDADTIVGHIMTWVNK